MNRAVILTVSTSPSESIVQELRQNLIEYNTSCAGPENHVPLLLVLRDNTGKLVAGLAGKIYYRWLFVELLWVGKQARGHGHGRALLNYAEEEARRRGCQHVWLDTFSFQAPGFYEKNHYSLFGELADYPPGHRRYFFRKALGGEVNPCSAK